MPDITIKNPKGIKPQLDSDVSPKRKPSPSAYPQMSTGNYFKGDSGMDTSNPAKANTEPEPKKHPVDELFGRGIKRSNGRSIPREDVTISDN
jgi:hypothetical protein